MPVKYDSLCEDGVNFKAFWGALQLGDIETKPGVGPDLSLALGRQSQEANPEGAQGQLVAGETSPLPRRISREPLLLSGVRLCAGRCWWACRCAPPRAGTDMRPVL